MTLEQKIKATEKLTHLYYVKEKTKDYEQLEFYHFSKPPYKFKYKKYVFKREEFSGEDSFHFQKLTITFDEMGLDEGIRYHSENDWGVHNTNIPWEWLKPLAEIWGKK